MKATIVSTDRIVDIDAVGHPGRTEARVWEGITEAGVFFTAYIPTVQVDRKADNSVFEKELREHKQPSDETRRAIDLRFIL